MNIENLKIHIHDDLIKENCGVYEKINNTVLKTGNCTFDVSMDIGTFTQLVMGFYSADELSFFGLIKSEENIIDKLNKIFPKTNNYINHIMEE